MPAALAPYDQPDLGREAERRACEIRLRAERKAGELLKATEKAQGRQAKPNPATGAAVSPPTLTELGVSEKQSRNWQKLVGVPQEKFEEALADPTCKPSTSGVVCMRARGAGRTRALRPDPAAARPKAKALSGGQRALAF